MRSVFTKLSAVILIAAISINVVVFALFRVERRSSITAFQSVLARNIDYLIRDLGPNPRKEQASETAKDGLIYIRYSSPGTDWATDPDFSPPSGLRWYQWQAYPHIRSARWHSRYLVEVSWKDGTYLFAFGRNFDQEAGRTRLLVLILLLLTTLFVLVYLSIHWVLRPLKWLKRGVSEITRGNLSHKVPTGRADELKDLADAFNTMTERIRAMLHAKERLLLDVSHEMRSPLTRMRVAAEYIPEGHPKVSIQTDIREMDRMIADVLETARYHHGHTRVVREDVDLSTLIAEILPRFSNRQPEISFYPPKKPAIVQADPEQFKIVIGNVLDNAVKYSRPEGNPVEISIEKKKGATRVLIKDTGIGIPPEELDYILEPFYRVDKSRSKQTGGYGLGLSICKTVMEAHGGQIQITSIPGKGTFVSLLLPAG